MLWDLRSLCLLGAIFISCSQPDSRSDSHPNVRAYRGYWEYGNKTGNHPQEEVGTGFCVDYKPGGGFFGIITDRTEITVNGSRADTTALYDIIGHTVVVKAIFAQGAKGHYCPWVEIEVLQGYPVITQGKEARDLCSAIADWRFMKGLGMSENAQLKAGRQKLAGLLRVYGQTQPVCAWQDPLNMEELLGAGGFNTKEAGLYIGGM